MLNKKWYGTDQCYTGYLWKLSAEIDSTSTTFSKDTDGSNKTWESGRENKDTLKMTNNLQTCSMIYVSKGGVCNVVIYGNCSMLTGRMPVTSSKSVWRGRKKCI